MANKKKRWHSGLSKNKTRFAVRLEIGKAGWVKLHLSLGWKKRIVFLSDVYDPFEALLAWGQAIDAGALVPEYN